MRPILIAFLLLLATATVADEPPRPFIPEAALGGQSEGQGSLRFAFGQARPYRVDNVGTTLPDGTFQLDQTIHFEGKPVEARRWLMRRTAPGQYAFTLSEAAGPGTALAEGNRFALTYPADHAGVSVHQVLEVSADGKAIANDGRICFLGIPIGWLRETIRKP